MLLHDPSALIVGAAHRCKCPFALSPYTQPLQGLSSIGVSRAPQNIRHQDCIIFLTGSAACRSPRAVYRQKTSQHVYSIMRCQNAPVQLVPPMLLDIGCLQKQPQVHGGGTCIQVANASNHVFGRV